MMTLEQIQAERKRLSILEAEFQKLTNINRAIRMLNDEHCLVSVNDATSTMLGCPSYISTLLNDRENDVMKKSIQVALEFAKQRLEKELESKC